MYKVLKLFTPIILSLYICVFAGQAWASDAVDPGSAEGRLAKLATNNRDSRIYEGYFETITGAVFLIGGPACMLNPSNTFPLNAVYGFYGLYSGIILYVHGQELINKPTDVEKVYATLSNVPFANRETASKDLLMKESERAHAQRLTDSVALGWCGALALCGGPTFSVFGGLSLCTAFYNYYYAKSSSENEYEGYLKGQ